jgi:hypothetical protein
MAGNRHAAAHYVAAVVVIGMGALVWNASRASRSAPGLLSPSAQPAGR